MIARRKRPKMQNGIMQRKQTKKRATEGTAILIRSTLLLSRKKNTSSQCRK